MKSEWRVSSNPVCGKMIYGAYRIRDLDEIDHSGNRENTGPIFYNKDEAEAYVNELNKKELGT